MPHKDVLSIYSRHGKLTDEEWIHVLEARKAFLMREIRGLGQGKIRDVSIWKDRGNMSDTVAENISDEQITSPDKTKFNLDTRGVFVFDRSTYKCLDTHHAIMNVCGFTRTGLWLRAEVEIQWDAKAVLQ